MTATASVSALLQYLQTAQFVTPATYNVLGYIAMNSATLGDAIGKIDHYEKLVGDMGTTSIGSLGEQTQLAWNCCLQSPTARRHVIENVLGSWVAYARWIAGALHVSERSLHRHLAQHGHGFQDMLDDIRIELAKRYLRDVAIPMTFVTQRLGFAEDRSFFRFFRNKTGITPAQFRIAENPPKNP